MAITGISAISGEQIIAAGAVSAREAASAAFTTGGDNLQGLYDTVSNNSASWTGGAGGGLPMAIGDSAVFNSGYEMNNEYCPSLYLSGNMYNYPLLQVRGGYNTEGASGALRSNYISFHTGYTTGTSTYQVLRLDRDGLTGKATNYTDWYFRPYEYGLLTGTYDTVSNNSASWGGGSDVPEGVMVESGLEYNAVNEISGYNGSAIAQYGAEKQWLQHDDTIVHVSNSAQYAFGCNISALQRLMGIDETVIYESGAGAVVNSANVITLNESLQNFEMIKITDNSLPVGGDRRLTTIPVSTATKSIATNDAWFDVSYNPTQGASKYIGTNFYSANDAGTQIRMNGSYITNMSNTGAWANRNQGRLYKIIGVHRISG